MLRLTYDPVVHMGHIRAAALCTKGTRAWCAHYGIDHNRLRDGTLRAAELEATGDHYAAMVCAAARNEPKED